jgi:hypothetical protein
MTPHTTPQKANIGNEQIRKEDAEKNIISYLFENKGSNIGKSHADEARTNEQRSENTYLDEYEQD